MVVSIAGFAEAGRVERGWWLLVLDRGWRQNEGSDGQMVMVWGDRMANLGGAQRIGNDVTDLDWAGWLVGEVGRENVRPDAGHFYAGFSVCGSEDDEGFKGEGLQARGIQSDGPVNRAHQCRHVGSIGATDSKFLCRCTITAPTQ